MQMKPKRFNISRTFAPDDLFPRGNTQLHRELAARQPALPLFQIDVVFVTPDQGSVRVLRKDPQDASVSCFRTGSTAKGCVEHQFFSKLVLRLNSCGGPASLLP